MRGGWGIFYSNLITLGGMQSMEINPPNHLRINQSTERGRAVDLPEPGIRRRRVDAASSRATSRWSPRTAADKTPTAYQWNVNVQRELPGASWSTSATTPTASSTTGGRSTAIRRRPAPGDINARRRFTTAIVPGTDDAITLAERRAHPEGRLEPVSRAADQGREALREGACRCWRPTPGRDTARLLGRRLSRIRSTSTPRMRRRDTDRRHYFVASGVYELPFGRTVGGGGRVGAVLGGWSLSPIVTIASGAPLNLTVNGNPANTGQNDRPNVVGDWSSTIRPSSSGSTPRRSSPTTATPTATRRGICCAGRARSTSTSSCARRSGCRLACRPTSASSRSTSRTLRPSATRTRRSAIRTSAASRRPARPEATSWR